MTRSGLLSRVASRPAATIRPAQVDHLRTAVTVPAPVGETFAFFANASNLERLTPPWVQFRIRTPMPVVMAEGLLLDYEIVIRGLRVAWKTRIDVWEPGVRFVDRQLIGPYLWWRHEHLFQAVPDGTLVTDRVEFVPRARWVSGWLVRRDVARIFEFRKHALGQLLAAPLEAGG
jgi:ligand-binding SRPBCC domain-containing protein